MGFSEDNGSGDLGWRKLPAFPELFASTLRGLKIGELSEPITSGAGKHLLFLEDKRGPTVTFEKQWEVRHILLIPNRIRPDEASEKLIEEIKERIEAGESFATLASEYSDDPGSKQEGRRRKKKKEERRRKKKKEEERRKKKKKEEERRKKKKEEERRRKEEERRRKEKNE